MPVGQAERRREETRLLRRQLGGHGAQVGEGGGVQAFLARHRLPGWRRVAGGDVGDAVDETWRAAAVDPSLATAAVARRPAS